MKFIKSTSVLLLVILTLWFLLPIPLPGQAGIYNPVSGLLWCSSHDTCLHEVGHELDDEGGWVSHTEAFSQAVYLFVGSELIAHDVNSKSYNMAHAILKTPGVITWRGRWLDSQSEIYAIIFVYSDGKAENLPPVFRPFYDWDRAEELLKTHQKYPREG